MIDVGDYGYGREYKLYDKNNKLKKDRSFMFSTDAEFREMRETVNDYTSKPPKQYVRIRNMEQHYSQFNELPLMANGNWAERVIKEEDLPM